MTGPKGKLRTTDIEDDSGIYDPFTPERTTDAKRARNDGKCKALIRKRILDNKWIIASIILNISLIITIIVLAVKPYEEKPCPICAPCVRFACPESWIIKDGKYFYVSKEAANWSTSSNICSSFNASLAVIATQKELDFCASMLHSDHWFGLSGKDQVWKWPNGTEFTNQFPVKGEGFCAYVNGKGADSTMCSVEKLFLCSYPEDCRKT
ncbi:C-type lectin domain family 2 member D-like [Pituophis catenifer annectens]|uniref:C-type lectin domain family 2 member D-like n=1 Tax=Pituophis catenifer annectens TaxID=94852 RepID=UPI003995E7B3